MASQKQIDLFNQLAADKDFGDKDVEKLKAQFVGLNTKSASAWIEKAMELPDSGYVPPSF